MPRPRPGPEPHNSSGGAVKSVSADSCSDQVRGRPLSDQDQVRKDCPGRGLTGNTTQSQTEQKHGDVCLEVQTKRLPFESLLA